MAYGDYGAIVLKNGIRRYYKEDVAIFTDPEETFGTSVENVASDWRIFQSLIKSDNDNREITWLTHIHHGILGDGNIRVLIHKDNAPEIYECIDGVAVRVEIPQQLMQYDEDKRIIYHFQYEYKGYKFTFNRGNPFDNEFNEISMIEPDGTLWSCVYGYGYGFDDDN